MTCPACGRPAYEFLRAREEHIRRYLLYSRIKYAGLLDDWLSEVELVLCGCRSCGHRWYKDQPSARRLEAMYAAGKPLFTEGPPSRVPTGKMVRTMRQLKRLVRRRPRPRLLDYGSGFGRWARAAAATGFDVYAYEPSTVRGAEDSPPFTIVHSMSELAHRTFDVVNIEQVLEHVADPVTTLQAVRTICVPETILRITVPNLLRSPEGTRLWDEWPFDGRRPHTMAPFEHLHGFTPASLACVVERAGFQHITAARLVASHPSLVARRAAYHLSHRFGQTLAIVEPWNVG